jgi:hypothetical protein
MLEVPTGETTAVDVFGVVGLVKLGAFAHGAGSEASRIMCVRSVFRVSTKSASQLLGFFTRSPEANLNRL